MDTAQEYKNLKLELEPPLAIVAINRPEELNALNQETIDEMGDCFAELAESSGIRCVIITGGEGKSFAAGADIEEISHDTVITGQRRALRGQRVFAMLEQMPQPVIAAINGYALGGGCELAMACDIRLASKKAKLGLPEVNLGIFPGYGGTQRLARLIGPGLAKKMIFTGDFIRANEALRIGLIDAVHPPDELMPEAMKLALKICSKGPLAIKAAKQAFNLARDTDSRSYRKYEAILFAAICDSEDKVEGIGAFLEKRVAEFKKK
ncbi:MAG: hypothetical protein GY839_09895 [candidate division Zixibacteria bacterium]|nr:hypothetical protein [candidate division Zixibacteria bacterium]